MDKNTLVAVYYYSKRNSNHKSVVHVRAGDVSKPGKMINKQLVFEYIHFADGDIIISNINYSPAMDNLDAFDQNGDFITEK